MCGISPTKFQNLQEGDLGRRRGDGDHSMGSHSQRANERIDKRTGVLYNSTEI